ncbi:MAG: alpha-glycosidase, partial [Lachnospiraceae bacterium]|nr:alpha-glycosidase [Lachnospiraceae bacterium]
FNHCGSFNKWMDRERIYENAPGYEKGAHVSKDSPYRSYFDFKNPDGWPYNTSYDGWWGYDTLPKLNYEASEELCQYVLEIGKKWVSPPFNADGWRLDVAADLGHSGEFNHKFWKAFRSAVKSANPNAIILAEHYGNAKDWLQGDEWDTVMNYDAFMEPVTWFLTGMEKHSDDFKPDFLGNGTAFWQAMQHHGATFTMPSHMVAMNELSNHDHSRFMTRTSHKVGRVGTLGSHAAEEGNNPAVFRLGVVMQMTWLGAPTIYYGDEAGVCGFTDPDNRRTYPWGNEDRDLIRFHREIIKIRKQNPELRNGSIKYVGGAKDFVAYARFTQKGQCFILINNSPETMLKKLPVWEVGLPKTGKLITLFQTDINGYRTFGWDYTLRAGRVVIDMPPYSGMILKYNP